METGETIKEELLWMERYAQNVPGGLSLLRRGS